MRAQPASSATGRGERRLELQRRLAVHGRRSRSSAGAERQLLARQDRVAARQQRGEPVGRAVLGAALVAARGAVRVGSSRAVGPLALGDLVAAAVADAGAPARGSGRRRRANGSAEATRNDGDEPREVGGAEVAARRRRAASRRRWRRRRAGRRRSRSPASPGRCPAARGGRRRRGAVPSPMTIDLARVVAGVAADDVAAGRRAEPARELPLDEAEAALFGRRQSVPVGSRP